MAKEKEMTTADILETIPQKIIPPTSEHFEYTAFTKEDGNQPLSKMLRGENKNAYSYALATLNEHPLFQGDTARKKTTDFWSTESGEDEFEEDELLKCHIVKAKSNDNEVGFVKIGLSSLKDPIAPHSMYEFQILTKDSVSQQEQQEIITATLVDYLKNNSSFLKSDYLVGTIYTENEVKNSIIDNFAKSNNITVTKKIKEAKNALVKVQHEKAESLEKAGLSKFNLSENINVRLVCVIQDNKGNVFKIQGSTLLEIGADGNYKSVDMWYYVDYNVIMHGLCGITASSMPKTKEITAADILEIIPPTSDNFKYITLTEDNGLEFLKKIFQDESKKDYSYALATFNGHFLYQDNVAIEDILYLWDIQSGRSKLPKCYIVKVKSGDDAVGFVSIGLSSLEGPKAQQKMYELQTLIKDSVSPNEQQEIIKAASVEHLKKIQSL